MKVSTGELLERMIQNLPGSGSTMSGEKSQARSSFSELLDAAGDKGQSGGKAPLDREKLAILLEIMRVQMNYSVMNSLGGNDDGGPASNSLAWMNRMQDLPGIGPVESRIGRTPPADRQSVPRGEINAIIEKASRQYGVDSSLIESVIRAESGFDSSCTSPKGAMGLMQLMPGTAQDLGVKNPYDAQENIMAGTRYLKTLLDRYHGNTPLALAAYNWGMGNLERNSDNLPEETRNYVSKIMKDFGRADG